MTSHSSRRPRRLAATVTAIALSAVLGGGTPASAAAPASRQVATTDPATAWCPAAEASVAEWDDLVNRLGGHVVASALAAAAVTVRSSAREDVAELPGSDSAASGSVSRSDITTLLRYRGDAHRMSESTTLLVTGDGRGTTMQKVVQDRHLNRRYERFARATTRSAQRRAQLRALKKQSIWVRSPNPIDEDWSLLEKDVPEPTSTAVFGRAVTDLIDVQDAATAPTCGLDDQGRLVVSGSRGGRLVATFDDLGRIVAVTSDVVRIEDDGSRQDTDHRAATITYSSAKISLPSASKTVTEAAWDDRLAHKLMPKVASRSLAAARKAVKGVKGRAARRDALARAVAHVVYGYQDTYGEGFCPLSGDIVKGARVLVVLYVAPRRASFHVELKGSKVVVNHRHLP